MIVPNGVPRPPALRGLRTLDTCLHRLLLHACQSNIPDHSITFGLPSPLWLVDGLGSADPFLVVETLFRRAFSKDKRKQLRFKLSAPPARHQRFVDLKGTTCRRRRRPRPSQRHLHRLVGHLATRLPTSGHCSRCIAGSRERRTR